MEEIKELAHRIKLIITLFVKMKSRYRVEVEDYFPETWDSTSLNYYHFNDLVEAQRFVKEYAKPFYIIRLLEQVKDGWGLCNIDTGYLATKADEDGIDSRKDKYGYDLPVELSAGWYRRGWHTHNPIWMKIADDYNYMMDETVHRYVESARINNGLIMPLNKVINTMFEERHPDAPKYFRRNFKVILMNKMETEARKAGML